MRVLESSTLGSRMPKRVNVGEIQATSNIRPRLECRNLLFVLELVRNDWGMGV